MAIELVEILDSNQYIIATAEVEDNGEYYSGSVNLDRMTQLLRSQFEELESIVNSQMWNSLDKIYEQIQISSFTVVFDDGRKLEIEEIQIYPIEGVISFWVD